MPEQGPSPELMRSLGQLVRGLSALFWGLPAALLVFGLLWIETVTVSVTANPLTQWILSLGILPPLAVSGILFYGLLQLGAFQRQERVWQSALERTKIVSMVLIGLSPFLHWWNQMPEVTYFALAAVLLVLFSLLFLASLNQALNRLAAMLPDETLRLETRFFTSLNHYLLGAIVLLAILYFLLSQFSALPDFLTYFIVVLHTVRSWLLLFLILIPVAMSMTLAWKIKEVILASVFNSHL